VRGLLYCRSLFEETKRDLHFDIMSHGWEILREVIVTGRDFRQRLGGDDFAV